MSQTQHFQVELAENSHPVWIGKDILSQAEVWPRPGKSNKAVVFIDQFLAGYQPAICEGLRAAGWEPVCEQLEASEALKDFENLFPLYGKLLDYGLQRSSLLVAVGGGTIGDSIGFLASTFLRGIRWVSVPTSLLAQVDSGLGGKTGVNHPAGKNLIGAVWQPSSIVCDTRFLEQLSQRDMISGLGEIFKYGLIHDADFWQWLISHREALLARQAEVLSQAVTRSLQIKAHYVQQDQYDSKGIRAVLNFGHTFGHALEARAGYGEFRHGEAVIWGMRVASFASRQLGMITEATFQAIQTGLEALPVPKLPPISSDDYLSALKFDKKSEGQQVQTLLLSGIGQVETRAIELDTWRQWLEEYSQQSTDIHDLQKPAPLLFSCTQLQTALGTPDLIVVDTRYDLKDPNLGYQQYLAGHIPGAIYMDLGQDLSDFEQGLSGGRHPLPTPETFAQKLAQKGIGNESQVVVYDAHGGMYAARLWWMLRWLGHANVSLLDGGLSGWIQAGGELESGDIKLTEKTFVLKAALQKYVSQAEIERRLPEIGSKVCLIDVRAPERYRGEVEPLDAKAGHIPGAINRPFSENLEQGFFKSAEDLNADYQALGIGNQAENIVYCGSGVTACQQILAMELAGLHSVGLYGGSWSEWSQNH